MKIHDFKLERYFAQYEFSVKYLLSSSDCDGFELTYILDQASKKELELWDKLQLGYTDSKGHPLLRESILQYYDLEDIHQVVVSSPGELNFISMNILVNPGDHVICVAPAYQSLYEIVRSLGGELSFWKPNPENWEFEVEALAPLIQDNTKLIVLNFPHNPTGAYLTRTQLEAIVALSRKHDITIFSDEMYNKLLPGGTPPLPPVCDLYEKGISLWGTSKSFGLAGLRTGWLVCQNRSFLDKVVAFKDYLSICTSAPSEVLSLIALNHIEAFLEPNLQKIERNIAYFKEFMGTTDIIPSFIPPKAGSTAFVPLNIESTALEFSNQLVKETSIMTLPAEMFEYEGKYIRVGFGRENFPEALQLFADYLEALSNHST